MIFSRLRSLWPNGHFFLLKARLALVKSLIVPLFTYMRGWFTRQTCKPATFCFFELLLLVIDLFIGLYAQGYSERLLGCSILNYLRYRQCLFLHRLVISKAPDYLYSKLQLGRSSQNRMFVLTQNTWLQCNRSFVLRPVSNFHSWPESVKRMSSIMSFKRAYFKLR